MPTEEEICSSGLSPNVEEAKIKLVNWWENGVKDLNAKALFPKKVPNCTSTKSSRASGGRSLAVGGANAEPTGTANQ